MFGIAIVFLVCQAVLVVLWVDVPALREKFGEKPMAALSATGDVNGDDTEFGQLASPLDDSNEHEANEHEASEDSAQGELAASQQAIRGPVSSSQTMLERAALGLVFLIWPVVIAESVYHIVIRPKTREMAFMHAYSMLFCLCPSLRMCARSAEMGGRLWLPGWSWQRPNRRLRRRLEHYFSVPMIGIALLIVPILLVEFSLKDQVARHAWLRISLHIGTGVIWFAFAAEFILMISIAEKKFDYLRRHWVDVAIIVLPFFSFLRSIRALRGTRLARLVRVTQIANLARAFRLRGTVLRAFRALVLLDVFARLLRTTPETRLDRLQQQLTVTLADARKIRMLISRTKREIRMSEVKTQVQTGEGLPMEAHECRSEILDS